MHEHERKIMTTALRARHARDTRRDTNRPVGSQDWYGKGRAVVAVATAGRGARSGPSKGTGTQVASSPTRPSGVTASLFSAPQLGDTLGNRSPSRATERVRRQLEQGETTDGHGHTG